MKKTYLLLFFSFLFITHISAQYLICTDGNADIKGRISVGNNTEKNTFVGYYAGINNAYVSQFNGGLNTFLGTNAGWKNVSGYNNTFSGAEAGKYNTTGSQNTFVGAYAGERNTTAGFNSFFGENSGRYNTIGSGDTFLGSGAGFNNTNGWGNTFTGVSSGFNNTTGYSNTFMGAEAGKNVTTGNNNTLLGYKAYTANAANVNAIAIGANTTVSASNRARIGDANLTQIGGAVGWSNLSDGRYKNRIKKDDKGLDFILALQPVFYHFDTKKLNEPVIARLKKIQKSEKTKGYKLLKEQLEQQIADIEKAAKEKAAIKYNGFIAQQVEEAMDATDYHFSGLIKPENDQQTYALRYAGFVVPLVGAIQRQQEMIKEKEDKIEQLESDVAELKNLVNNLIDAKNKGSIQTTTIESAKLGQNMPNPFNDNTSIPYAIPNNSQTATIQIHNLAGQLIKTIAINSFGDGVLEVHTKGLSNGQYTYSLEVDGRIIETKKMNLVK